MKRFLKNTVIVLLSVAILLVGNSSIPNCNSAYNETNQSLQIRFEIGNTNYWVNGVPVEKQVVQETAPVIKNGRTFILLRYLVKQLPWIGEMKFEKNVELYPKGRVEIGFTDRDKKIYLYVDESIAEVVEDGKTSKIQIDPENEDVVPFIISGRLHLPLRFLGEQTDAIKILWDDEKKLAELWYISPYEVALTNRTPVNGYNSSRARFSEVTHHTEPLDDFCFDEYWEVKIEYDSWDLSTKNVLCVSKKLGAEIERLNNEESYVLFKYLCIGKYIFIIDVKEDDSEVTDCCDFDVDIEVEESNPGLMWRIWLKQNTKCSQQVTLRADCNNRDGLRDAGYYCSDSNKVFGTFYEEQNNESLLPTYENHFGNDEYSEEDDNYYNIKIEEAFDTVSTSDGNIHLLWTEEYILYKSKNFYLLNYAYYDGKDWRNAKNELYPENSALVSRHAERILDVSLAVGENNTPHIAWDYNYKEGHKDVIRLSYARWNGTEWVDNSNKKLTEENYICRSGSEPELLLDSSNNPYIFCLNKGSIFEVSELGFIYSKEPGVWLNLENKNIKDDIDGLVIREIPTGLNYGFDDWFETSRPFSVVMDSKDNIHLVYQADYDGKCCIFYDVFSDGKFSENSEPVNYLEGMNPVISIDEDDNPIIMWSDYYKEYGKWSTLARIFFIKKSENGWENIHGEDIQNNSALLFFQSSFIKIVPYIYPLGDNKYTFILRGSEHGFPSYKSIIKKWPEDIHSAQEYEALDDLWVFPPLKNTNNMDYILRKTFEGIYLYKTDESLSSLQSLDKEKVGIDYSGTVELQNCELKHYNAFMIFEKYDYHADVEAELPITVDIIIESDCGITKEYSVQIE